MPTYYRSLRQDEEDAVLQLWSQVLEDSIEMRTRVFRDFADEPQRFARTHVAVADDGAILSAAAYWLRELRDLNGTPCRTGHLWGVATHPNARRQGHARKVLGLAVEAMQQEGCQWTILFAREEARTLYTQAGWEGIPYQYRSAILTDGPLERPSAYLVRSWQAQQDEDGWAHLANIYESENQHRPLTMVRDASYWRGYTSWMLAEWIRNQRAEVLVAAPKASSNELCGYIIAHFYDAAYAQQTFGSPPWFFISEIGTFANDKEVTKVLLRAVKERALSQGMRYGQMLLPDEPNTKMALKEIFGDTLQTHTGEGSSMIRAISSTAPRLPLAYIDNGFIWSLDQF